MISMRKPLHIAAEELYRLYAFSVTQPPKS